MTSRERIEAALNHKEPDRTPIFEYVMLSPRADDFLGHPYAADPENWNTLVNDLGWESAVKQIATDYLDLAMLLGHDMLYVLPNPLPLSYKTIPSFEPTSDDPVENVLCRNNFYKENKSDLPEDSFFVYIHLKNEMKNRDIDLPILAPAYEHGVWTDIDLMQTMLLEPETAHEHFSLATERAFQYIEKYISLGIDQIGVGGDFSGSRPLISPASYREFIVPEVKNISKYIHSRNCYAVNASDGDLWPVIDEFLLGCDVDGYIEVDSFAGMNIKKLKDLYGDKITFYGNLDCGNLLSFSSPEEIKNVTIKCIESGLGNGGHILSASNAISGSIPLTNYLAVIEAYREFFGLDKLSLD